MAETNGTTKRLWGRASDYLFGRNTLIGVASLMLLTISGFATWSGMSDFILGVSTSPASQGRKIPLGLSVTNEFLVIAIVVALTFLMWLALRETFAAQRKWKDRLTTFPLYLFLALWSIGFGYGFWWSLIAGEEATRSSLSGLKEDARDAGTIVAARLDAVRIQLDNVVAWSENQMAREEASGGSCGKASGAGRGPLFNARRSVRDQVASLRDGITRSWLGPVNADLDQLRLSAARLEGTTVAERQQRFEAMAADVRGRARSIAARSNELGKSTAAEMNALADLVSVAPGEAVFSCYDPTLAQRLRQAAVQASEPASLQLREAQFSEGAAGVANAVKNLWTNVGGYLSGLGRYVISGGKDAGDTAPGGTPITGRDLIALLATLGVDLGLFALMVVNPPKFGSQRASPEVTRHLTSAIRTAISQAPGTSFKWVHRHFIHHGQESFFVIPNIYSVDQDSKDEEQRALAMNHLAGVFSNLDLIRPLKPKQLKRFRAEEMGTSATDLSGIRKQRKKELQRIRDAEIAASGADPAEIKKQEETSNASRTGPSKSQQRPVRAHGLLSKAERALDIAGWSEGAVRDIEIFKLVDTEDLTPLLIVLNEEADARESKAEHAKGVKAIAKDSDALQIADKRES